MNEHAYPDLFKETQSSVMFQMIYAQNVYMQDIISDRHLIT